MYILVCLSIKKKHHWRSFSPDYNFFPQTTYCSFNIRTYHHFHVPVSALPQMLAMNSIFATPQSLRGPSAPCGLFWTASTRCGCPFTGPGASMSATMVAWLGWTRPKQQLNTERPRLRSGGALLTLLPRPWMRGMTSIRPSARWRHRGTTKHCVFLVYKCRHLHRQH